MFEGISAKINLLMAKEGISGMQLARKLGMPASTIKKIRSKKITNPTVATLAPIARYFSVSLDYLLGESDDLNNSFNLPLRHYNLPLISWEDVAKHPHIPTRGCSYVVSEHDYDTRVFALLIERLDEAALTQNSFIVIDPTVLPKHCDFVITVKNETQKAILKQFLCDEGKNYLRSLNSENNVEQFTAEYRLIGVVTEYHNQFKNTKLIKHEVS